jgi:hypothetical protein
MFKGNFKLKNSYGKPITYNRGDIVIYQGKLYECKLITQKTPFQQPLNWSFTGCTELIQSSDPPLNPKVGQMWSDLDGNMYIWYQDNDGFQWIQT